MIASALCMALGLAAREEPQVAAAGHDAQVLHGGAVLDDGRDDVAVAARERRPAFAR